MANTPRPLSAHLARAWHVLGLSALVLQVGWWLPSTLARTDILRDSPVYYYAAQRAAAGEPLYAPHPNFGPTTPYAAGYPQSEAGYIRFLQDWFLYPPHCAAILTPLVGRGLPGFMQVFTVIALLSAWAYAACLTRLAEGRLRLRGFLLANLLLMLVPGTTVTMGYGNIDPLLWALFGLALVSPRARAAALTVAASIKPYLAWFAIASAWGGGPRPWAVMAGTSAAILGFGVWRLGAEPYLDWLRTVPPVLSQGTVDLPNLSLSLLPLRLAWAAGWPEPAGPLPAWASAYLLACSVAGPLLALWLLRRRTPELRFAACTVAAVFLSPYCMPTYLPLLLAVAACWWRERGRAQPAGVRGAAPGVEGAQPACA